METLRYFGAAEESAYGVEPSPAAQFDVDIASASLDAPSDTQMQYGGGLRRGAQTHRPGYYSPSGNVVYAFDVRTLPRLLKWALGNYAFTDLAPAPAPNKRHELYASDDNILPSFAARLGKDAFEHIFAGCVIGSLQLEIEGEFATATAEVQAKNDAKGALRARSALLLPAEYPLAFHEMTVELPAASDISAVVKSLTLQINNNPRGDSGRGAGSRFPQRMPVGDRDITLSLNLWYEDTAQLERFWGGATGPAAAGPAEYAMKVTLAAAGTDGSIDLDLPRCIHTGSQQQASGRDEITQAVAVKAFPGTIALADLTNVTTEILATALNNQAEMVAAA